MLCCAALQGLCSAPAPHLHAVPAAARCSQHRSGEGVKRAGWEGVPVCAIPGYALGLLQTKALIDKLQKLVSSEGRFKNLREALKK